jgi:hypothetical protein
MCPVLGGLLMKRESCRALDLSVRHSCIEAKGVLAMAQSSKSCSPTPAENYDKPNIQALLCGFQAATWDQLG